ncbi:MAG: hypothetical protein P4K80_03940 [Acidobacteriaceae bacterium]|nr:hypothetical protein [Acidobacteriaceae bacterium]
MKPQSSAHLSQEALNDLLIGLGSSASQAHLEQCASCREQVESFRCGMDAFNSASLAWSEAGAGKSLPRRSQARHAFFAPLAWTLATATLLLIGIPTWRHEHRAPQSLVAAQRVAPQSESSGVSDAEIAEDNDLLRAVDAALRTDQPSPLRNQRPRESHTHRKVRLESRSL